MLHSKEHEERIGRRSARRVPEQVVPKMEVTVLGVHSEQFLEIDYTLGLSFGPALVAAH